MKVPNCRVPSSEASRRTVKRRSDGISQVRHLTSGGDSAAQMAAEVKDLSKEEREKLLSEAQLPIVVPTQKALAMKADLAIPWNKLRSLRRYVLQYSGTPLFLINHQTLIIYYHSWFKTFNVHIASEARLRKMSQEIIGTEPISERAAFSFKVDKHTNEIREVPFVYYPNLIAKVSDVIHQHEM